MGTQTDTRGRGKATGEPDESISALGEPTHRDSREFCVLHAPSKLQMEGAASGALRFAWSLWVEWGEIRMAEGAPLTLGD